jgi:hypothetical protein
MGNWRITITGTGSHHNVDVPGDADKLFREFVEKLRWSQQVHGATFEVLNQIENG